jgi:hypothetical protein
MFPAASSRDGGNGWMMVFEFVWRTGRLLDEAMGTDIRPVSASRRRCQTQRVDLDPLKSSYP